MVTLRGDDFRLEAADLEAAISPRTRAVMLNSPLNPAGKVFSPAELETVADACRRHDLLAVTDEVYEHLVFDGAHVPLASPARHARPHGDHLLHRQDVQPHGLEDRLHLRLPRADERPAHRPPVRDLRGEHARASTRWRWPCAPPTPTTQSFLAEYRARRDRLCAGLREAGFAVAAPAGTYFAVADIRPLGYDDDVAFCRMLPERCGVAAIPVSAFHSRADAPRHLVRFAFCKTDAMLDEGLRRLRRLKDAAA